MILCIVLLPVCCSGLACGRRKGLQGPKSITERLVLRYAQEYRRNYNGFSTFYHMTTVEVVLVTGLYLIAWIAVAYFTRADFRRIAGAAAGGAVFGVVALIAVALGEEQGWWRVPKAGSSYFQLLIWICVAVSCAPVYLITWRLARRFGRLGLASCVVAAALIGPPRDYAIAAAFPNWIDFTPGITPILADATLYVLLVAVGHASMRMLAGPAQGDSLARRI
jgi:hypothetical protein